MGEIMLTNDDVQRLRASFFEIIPLTDDLSQEFYAKLFTEHPEVRSFFKPDLQSQKDKLVDTIAVILDTIAQPEEAMTLLRSLGKRHVHYGATPELYVWTEKALVEALLLNTRQEDRQNLQELWSNFFRWILSVMMEGAQDP